MHETNCSSTSTNLKMNMWLAAACKVDGGQLLASPKQTAIGKDSLNPFMVVVLPKAISFVGFAELKNREIGQEVALFPTMQIVPEPSTLPSRITSSPSYSHAPSPSPTPSPSPEPSPTPDHTTAAVSQPSPTQPSPGAEHHLPTPNESPLHDVHSHGSDDVKKLEYQVKTGKARKRARIVLSEDDGVIEDDSSKQGRKLSDVEVTPTEVIQDQGSGKKGNSKVSTAGATKGTASEVPVVSTAEVNISTAGRTVTYRRMSEEKRKRKDMGKSIMTEPGPKKKSKKELEQERLSLAEAIRLQEQMDEA
ncbi:hypothetical protein Tco_1028795 [Tanacetum coccineum]|uniref:Uncharacterized protein n=1 Tax=Tanacetum coccineum TaxID=301880 RepID=A0ABQ5G228_9ASTR